MLWWLGSGSALVAFVVVAIWVTDRTYGAALGPSNEMTDLMDRANETDWWARTFPTDWYRVRLCDAHPELARTHPACASD